MSRAQSFWLVAKEIIAKRGYGLIAVFAVAAILVHLLLRFGFHAVSRWQLMPLWLVLIAGGAPLTLELLFKALHQEFG